MAIPRLIAVLTISYSTCYVRTSIYRHPVEKILMHVNVLLLIFQHCFCIKKMRE